MLRAMPLDPDFVADCPYGPGGLLIDEVLLVDKEQSLVRVRMPTHADMPLTREQRNHPVLHPPHVSGALMVHMTGVTAMVHAYHLLDMRHKDGWIGYGVRIHHARFHHLATLGPPMILECQAVQSRKWGARLLTRYHFRFSQNDHLIYDGDQTAMFLKLDPNQPEAATF